MSLSCVCRSDPAFYFEPDQDLKPLDTKRRRRCQSCKKLIGIGEQSLRFIRYRPPRGEYEEHRFGDDYDAVPLASVYHCEECAGLYWAFEELGFCAVQYHDCMRDLVAEYNQMQEELKSK